MPIFFMYLFASELPNSTLAKINCYMVYCQILGYLSNKQMKAGFIIPLHLYSLRMGWAILQSPCLSICLFVYLLLYTFFVHHPYMEGDIEISVSVILSICTITLVDPTLWKLLDWFCSNFVGLLINIFSWCQWSYCSTIVIWQILQESR